jgi:hypothetical protein
MTGKLTQIVKIEIELADYIGKLKEPVTIHLQIDQDEGQVLSEDQPAS